jgi:hypothetical protein
MHSTATHISSSLNSNLEPPLRIHPSCQLHSQKIDHYDLTSRKTASIHQLDNSSQQTSHADMMQPWKNAALFCCCLHLPPVPSPATTEGSLGVLKKDPACSR